MEHTAVVTTNPTNKGYNMFYTYGAYCAYCDDPLDTDCWGEYYCPNCDGPCPGCYSGPGPGE